ncbi:MAG: peptidase [Gemmatimonadetes bacterium]|nr:peptidase [Gemmatimonadota bacterium]
MMKRADDLPGADRPGLTAWARGAGTRLRGLRFRDAEGASLIVRPPLDALPEGVDRGAGRTGPAASPPGQAGARGLALAALAVTAAALGMSWLPYVPPAAKPATAPASEFSAARALPHLRRIAQRPRPPGSAAHREVERYLQAQLRALGLAPSVQTTTVAAEPRGRQGVAATVTNIAARLPGRGGAHSILLVTHYDGVTGGPGANDAGVAVAALLETVRALRAGPPLRDDVVVLFTDGEESGLLGARAFSEAHPWARDVGLVLNFEARGTHGPALMFESSPGNAWLARGLRGADAPVASSLFYEIYRRLPNDTDFSVFKRSGLAGMNFAYIGGLTGYHTRLDDLASVDPRNVQHQGSYALGLARRFGAAELPAKGAANAVFFNLPLLGLVSYGEGWSAPLAAAAFLLLLAAIGGGVRTGTLRPWRTVLGFGGFAGMLLLVGALLTGTWLLIRATHPAYAGMPMGETYNGALYFAAFVLLTVTLAAAVHRWARKRLTPAELLAAALLAWGAGTLAFGVGVPGAGYLWLWPTVFAAAGLWVLLRSGAGPPAGRRLLVAGLGAVPALLLVAPAVRLLYEGMTVQSVGLLMVPVALVLGLMLPHLELAQRAGGRAWLLAPALAAVVLLAAAEARSPFDAAHPRPNSLFYLMDAGRNEASWASSDARPDAWTSRFLGSSPRRGPLSGYFPAIDYPFLWTPAPAVAAPRPPLLELLSDERRADGRVLRVRVRSQRGGEQVWVNVAPGAEIVSVNGRALGHGDRDGGPSSLRYVGLPADGIEVAVHVRGRDAVKIQAVDRTSGLPDLPDMARHPRPRDTMPTPILNSLQDATFIGATLAVPAA